MAHSAEPTRTSDIPEHDPTRDIDGRLTWTWLLACTIGVFLTVFVLHLVYEELRFAQHREVVELAPTSARDELHMQERAYLDADPKANRISVEQALERYVGSR
ncbi:MAG: hypothetical protein IPM29_32115 [Planctomycetes bacterium]|nr:hypothetical protein [Planctomycetota bacterium]